MLLRTDLQGEEVMPSLESLKVSEIPSHILPSISVDVYHRKKKILAN